jgi:hypothetical protein
VFHWFRHSKKPPPLAGAAADIEAILETLGID